MDKIFKIVLFIVLILLVGYLTSIYIYYRSPDLKNSQKIEEKNNYLNNNVNSTLSSDEYSVSKSKDGILTLELDGGKSKTYKDISEDSENFRGYEFSNFYKDINSYLIKVSLYEGAHYLLVNKITGEEVSVPGNNIEISLDKIRFASSSSDVVAGFSQNGFEIFRLENNHFVKEMELYPENWGPAYIIWNGVNEITVYKEVYSEDSDSISATKLAGILKYKLVNNIWAEEK